MKLAFITPTKYLDKFATQGDIYLALAHLIDDKGQNDYAQFHIKEKEKGRIVYLDNGLFEGAQVDPLALIHRAKLIGADVVCAPDALYDAKQTVKEFKRFIKLKQDEGLVAKVMGIPQADNPGEWWGCYQFMDSSKDCDMIGLSILSIPASFQHLIRMNASDIDQPIAHSRMHLIEQLYTVSHLTGKRVTPMHLLGLGESYDDIEAASHYLPRDIVSNDSSSAFVHGMHGVIYEETGAIHGGKIKEKLDFSLETLNPWQENAIDKNIKMAKEFARSDFRWPKHYR